MSYNYLFRAQNQRGNLIMSILVGAGIVALLSAAVLPYLLKYQPNLKLNGVARDLATDLRYAQQMTITEQIEYLVQLDLASNNYKIQKVDTATTTLKTVVFPAEVNYQQVADLTDNQVVFNSYGAVRQSGQIVLVNTNGKTAIINVKPSGYIQLVQ